jgi:hypothetical protein
LLLSEKITLFVALWIIVALFITGNADLEIFFILIFVGMLIVKEFTDRFTTVHIRHRINIFIYINAIIFIVFAGNKIISLLDI